MSDIVYLNGEFLPADQAKVSVFDRGFLFGDGVYEVIPVINAVLIEQDYFLERLTRSTAEIDLSWPCSTEELLDTITRLARENGLQEGYIYMQLTRGAAHRDFAYPPGIQPTFMAFTSHKKILDNPAAESGVAVVTVDDLRWKRRDIKSLNLLAQCMAKQQATLRGGYEGWMMEDGFITEGSASSAFIVRGNTLVTRPLSNAILPGIRRRVILELAEAHGIGIEQRAFTLEEALLADEAFLSSATTLVLPIHSIDGQRIGTQCPGPVTRKTRDLYLTQVRLSAGLK